MPNKSKPEKPVDPRLGPPAESAPGPGAEFDPGAEPDPGEAERAPEPEPEPEPRNSVSPVEWTAIGVFLGALLVGMICSVRQGWIPIADEALMELRVRDIPAHLPLVGVYSRYGWNHPGPVQFYLLWVFYKLGRSSSSALLVGSLTLHATWSLLAWRSVRSIDRTVGMLVLAGSAAILASTSPAIIRTPWNPYVVLVGGIAVIALGWATAQRLDLGAIALFPVASVMVQSHVVTAPTVTLVVIASLVIMFMHSQDRVGVPWRALGIGTAVAVAMWVPTIVQQFTGDPGNLTAMLRSGGEDGTAGLRSALGVVSESFAWWPSILRPSKVEETLVYSPLTVPVWLLLPIAGGALAWRGRRRPEDSAYLRGLAICFAGLVGVTLSTAATSGFIINYLVVTTRPVAIMTMIIGLGAILNHFDLSCRDGTLRVSAALVICLSVIIGIRQTTAQNPLTLYRPTVEELRRSVEGSATSNHISIQTWADSRSAEVSRALILQLERDGYDVAATDLDATYVGAHRTGRRPGYSVIVAPIRVRDEIIDDGWTVIGVYQPLSSADQRALNRLEGERERASDNDGVGGSEAGELARILEFEKNVAAIERGRVPMLVAGRPTS